MRRAPGGGLGRALRPCPPPRHAGRERRRGTEAPRGDPPPPPPPAPREQAQTAIQGAQQKHAGLLGLLEAGRARAEESRLRGERLRQDAGEVAHERTATGEALTRAAAELARARALSAELEERQRALGNEREQRRAALNTPRAGAQAAQLGAPDPPGRVPSRRAAESSMAV